MSCFSRTALLSLCVTLMLGIFQSIRADFTIVQSAVVNSSNELQSFVIGNRTVTQSELIQPTLTSFAGLPGNGNIPFPGGTVPIGAARGLLLTNDFRLDTGITNPDFGDRTASISFAVPLVNGPGADLVMFEIANADAINSTDSFQIRVNSSSQTFSVYGPSLVNVDIVGHTTASGLPPANINELYSAAYITGTTGSFPIKGVAVDLSDFGVAPMASVSLVEYGSGIDSNGVDSVLFMGIGVLAVPEPSSLGLLALATLFLSIIYFRRKSKLCVQGPLSHS